MTLTNLAVLDQIRDSLTKTLESVQLQEEQLAQILIQTTGGPSVGLQHLLDRLGDRLADSQQRVQLALSRAEQVEQMLADTETQYRRTRDQLHRLTHVLAQGPQVISPHDELEDDSTANG